MTDLNSIDQPAEAPRRGRRTTPPPAGEFDPVTATIVAPAATGPLEGDAALAALEAEDAREEPSAPQEAPLAPDSEEPQPAPAPADPPETNGDRPTRETTGKFVVLVFDHRLAGGAPDEGLAFLDHQRWGLLVNDDGEPTYYNGDRDNARREVLDDPRHEKLAAVCRERPGTVSLVAVPASSWAPAKPRPREVKTTWVLGS